MGLVPRKSQPLPQSLGFEDGPKDEDEILPQKMGYFYVIVTLGDNFLLNVFVCTY